MGQENAGSNYQAVTRHPVANGMHPRAKGIDTFGKGMNRHHEGMSTFAKGMHRRAKSIDTFWKGMHRRTKGIDTFGMGIDPRGKGIHPFSMGIVPRAAPDVPCVVANAKIGALHAENADFPTVNAHSDAEERVSTLGNAGSFGQIGKAAAT